MCTCAHKILYMTYTSVQPLRCTEQRTTPTSTWDMCVSLLLISYQYPGVSQLKIVLRFTYLYYRVPGIKKLNNTCYVLNMYSTPRWYVLLQ